MGTGSPRVGGGCCRVPPATPLRSHTRAPHQAPGHRPALRIVSLRRPLQQQRPACHSLCPGRSGRLSSSSSHPSACARPGLWLRLEDAWGIRTPGRKASPPAGCPTPAPTLTWRGGPQTPRPPAAPGGLTHPVLGWLLEGLPSSLPCGPGPSGTCRAGAVGARWATAPATTGHRFLPGASRSCRPRTCSFALPGLLPLSLPEAR